jgi:hypothetical protein
MNLNKTISHLRKTRKLLSICVHHSSAHPAIRIPDRLFNEVIPFLKSLLKSFDKNGFTVTISPWGEITAFSSSRGIAVLLVLEEPNPLSSVKGIKNIWSDEAEFQTLLVPEQEGTLVLKYFYYDTCSIWRSVNFDHKADNTDAAAASAVGQVIANGRKFEGRVISSPARENDALSKDDIKAFAKYASVNVENVRAWRGVYKTFANEYVEDFSLAIDSISLELSSFRTSPTFYFHKNDIKFIRKYLPGFPEDYLARGQK